MRDLWHKRADPFLCYMLRSLWCDEVAYAAKFRHALYEVPTSDDQCCRNCDAQLVWLAVVQAEIEINPGRNYLFFRICQHFCFAPQLAQSEKYRNYSVVVFCFVLSKWKADFPKLWVRLCLVPFWTVVWVKTETQLKNSKSLSVWQQHPWCTVVWGGTF